MLGAAGSGPGMAGAECRRGRPLGDQARAAVVALGFGLGLGLAAGCGCSAPTDPGGCLARSWVSAGLRARASSGRGPWQLWGCSRWGRVHIGFYDVQKSQNLQHKKKTPLQVVSML